MIGNIDKIFNSNVKAKGTVYEYVNKTIHSAKMIQKHNQEKEITDAVILEKEKKSTDAVMLEKESTNVVVLEDKKTKKAQATEKPKAKKQKAKKEKVENKENKTEEIHNENTKNVTNKVTNKKVPSDKVENEKAKKENDNVGMFPEGALSRAEQCAEKQIENKQKESTTEKTTGPIPYKVVQKARREKLIKYFEVNEPEIGD